MGQSQKLMDKRIFIYIKGKSPQYIMAIAFAFMSSIETNAQCTLAITSFTSIGADCYGSNTGSATLNIAGGTPGYTYNWNNGQTGKSATSLFISPKI